MPDTVGILGTAILLGVGLVAIIAVARWALRG
jgi:hypothetical protein